MCDAPLQKHPLLSVLLFSTLLCKPNTECLEVNFPLASCTLSPLIQDLKIGGFVQLFLHNWLIIHVSFMEVSTITIPVCEPCAGTQEPSPRAAWPFAQVLTLNLTSAAAFASRTHGMLL